MKSKLVKCKACGEELAKNAKKCPMCGAKNKKPIFKKWWFWLIVLLIIGSAGGGNETTSEPVNYASVPTQLDTTEAVARETEFALVEVSTIELIAGDAGKYGELLTLNKNTEFEETYYVYRIPAGTYLVTNVGEYMNQINVCSDEIHVTEEGWEEPAEVVYVKLLDVNASDTFTIADGQYIEIHESAMFTLELVSE